MKRVNLFKRWKIALVTIITKLLTFHAALPQWGQLVEGAVHLAVVEAHQAAAVL